MNVVAGALTLLTVLVAGAAGAGLRGVLSWRWKAGGLLAANTLASFIAGGTAAAVTLRLGLVVVGAPAEGLPLLTAGLAAFTLGLGTFSTLAVESAEGAMTAGLKETLGIWVRHLAWGVPAALAGALTVVALS